MTSQDNYESAVNASERVAEFVDTRRGFVHRLQHTLHTNPALVPLIVLVASIAIFGILLGSRFFSPGTLTLILQQVQIVGILAAAQSLIILTAGIDLSVGAIAVLCSVLMGRIAFYGFGLWIPWFNEAGWLFVGLPPMPATIAIFMALAIGTGIGAVSGWLVSRVKLPPFIVTLGMWQIVLATNYLYSRNETIRSQEIEADRPMLQWMGELINRQIVNGIEGLRGIEYANDRRPSDTGQPILDFIWEVNISYGILLMILLVVGLAFALRSTAWGRHVYAVGDDPDAAELAGVSTRKTLMSVYMLAGFICALAGWVMIGRFGSVSPSASTGVVGNIQAITAVVIGGISLFGGRGSIWGAFFGALIVGVFELGLRMMGANAQWTLLLIGILIIAAVSVDQWIRKVST
ncbi:ABC transporter permease [Rhodobacterales bacterium HKCCE4037]|nr:ABC transporter permease [Rhodobacterales bacterium HKCCE4037]